MDMVIKASYLINKYEMVYKLRSEKVNNYFVKIVSLKKIKFQDFTWLSVKWSIMKLDLLLIRMTQPPRLNFHPKQFIIVHCLATVGRFPTS